MTNTYAINTTRGKEFTVEEELEQLGLHPWCPRMCCSRYIREAKRFEYFDRAYIPKLMFCVIPAISFGDVLQIKHVIGKPYALSRLDIEGSPGGDLAIPINGLRAFQRLVEEEYQEQVALRKARDVNAEFQCQFKPGDALRVLSGPFTDFTAKFAGTIKHAHEMHVKIRATVEIFGRDTSIEVNPHEIERA